MRTALAWLFLDKGVSEVQLTVGEALTDAKALYRRVGFSHLYTGVGLRLDRSHS